MLEATKTKRKILCMPILPDNPTTNDGTASVILKILHLGGLLIPKKNIDQSNNSPTIVKEYQ